MEDDRSKISGTPEKIMYHRFRKILLEEEAITPPRPDVVPKAIVASISDARCGKTANRGCRNKTCYKCDQPGYIVKFCYSKLHGCYVYGDEGHIIRFRPRKEEFNGQQQHQCGY